MEVIAEKDRLRDRLAQSKAATRALVPTMGALHRGHTSLFDLAGKQGNDVEVVASIFVNPTQFGPGEDYEDYPRTLERDLELCREHGVDLVFAPTPGEMYRGDASATISESSLSRRLCGASRPGHFDGVCTVVAKLFHIVQPDVAIFGEKDFQQLAVLRRMARDLDLAVRIVGAPTVREPDGLALSSRNAYLEPEERAVAPVIHTVLEEGAAEAANANTDSFPDLLDRMRRRIEENGLAQVEYIEILNSETLEMPRPERSAPLRLLAAVRLGKTRLIDNVAVGSLA